MATLQGIRNTLPNRNLVALISPNVTRGQEKQFTRAIVSRRHRYSNCILISLNLGKTLSPEMAVFGQLFAPYIQ